MSEILILWLSALVSHMAPYLIFILLQKSTHSVNMVLYSQNARLCRNCALISPTINLRTEAYFRIPRFSPAFVACLGLEFQCPKVFCYAFFS